MARRGDHGPRRAGLVRAGLATGPPIAPSRRTTRSGRRSAPTTGGSVQVLRACVKATGEEWVVTQEDDGNGNGTSIHVLGLDRRWMLLGRASFSRSGACDGGLEVFPVDAGTRRQGRSARLPWCPEGAPVPVPDAPVAVTARSIAAWLSGEPGDRRLIAAAPDERVVELDRGAIDGLRPPGRLSSGPTPARHDRWSCRESLGTLRDGHGAPRPLPPSSPPPRGE